MKNIAKLGIAGMSVMALSACSSLGLSDNGPSFNGPNVTWINEKPIAFDPANAASVADNTTNLVFFRAKDEMEDQTAVNIGVNDRYQTSIRGGNYTVVNSCVGGSKISTAITRKKLNDLGFNPNIYDFEPKKNYYFEVSVDGQGNSRARKVAESEALEKLNGKQLQTHMVNRVQPESCRPYVARTPDPVPVSREKLFGVYYFDFDVPTLSSAERQRAYNLGIKIINTNKPYEVFLSGHADPSGTDSYNKALSRKRSISVAKVLEQAGVDPSKIKLGSFGESQPVILTCNGMRARSAKNGCNLKNRRVEVLVKLDGVASTMDDIDKIR